MVRDWTHGLRVSTAYVYVEDAPPPPPSEWHLQSQPSETEHHQLGDACSGGVFSRRPDRCITIWPNSALSPSAPSFRHLPSLIVLSVPGGGGGGVTIRLFKWHHKVSFEKAQRIVCCRLPSIKGSFHTGKRRGVDASSRTPRVASSALSTTG